MLKLTNIYIAYEYAYPSGIKFPIKSEIESNEIFLNSNYIVKMYAGKIFSFSENISMEVTIIETSNGKSIAVKEDIKTIRSFLNE